MGYSYPKSAKKEGISKRISLISGLTERRVAIQSKQAQRVPFTEVGSGKQRRS